MDVRAGNDENRHNSANTHPKNLFYAGNSISGRREAFGTSPEVQNGPETFQKSKNAGFGPQGNFTLVRIADMRIAFSETAGAIGCGIRNQVPQCFGTRGKLGGQQNERGLSLSFGRVRHFDHFLAASAAKNCKKEADLITT